MATSFLCLRTKWLGDGDGDGDGSGRSNVCALAAFDRRFLVLSVDGTGAD